LDEFDAIVIGSGFGGAVASSRLAQAGLSVLLLERGRRYEKDDFPALPDSDRLAPDLQRWTWQSNQGLWDVEDLDEIVAVQAAGYGGGSLIYANVHLRPPRGTFDTTWPGKFRAPEFEQFYDLAAFMLDVAPVDEHPERGFTKTRALERAAQNLGRSAIRPPLAVNYAEKINSFGEKQLPCTGCGKCCTGCPERAKNTLDLNYLAVAEKNGARVRTQCEVRRICQEEPDEKGPRWTVHFVDHLSARLKQVTTRALFVCAGSVHSTRLLAGAALRPESRAVKSRVGLGYFPNADAAGMIYDTAEETFPSQGPCITTSVVHWDTERDSFFMIQDGGYAPELARLSGILRAPLWVGRNRLRESPSPALWKGLETPEKTPFPGVALVSPLDALLDAAAEGGLKGLASAAMRTAWSHFLREGEKPLLLPSIVDDTLARAMHAKFSSWLLTRSFDQHGHVIGALGGFGRWVVRTFVGSSTELGDDAMRSLLAGADLERDKYARDMFGYDAQRASRRLLLLAMGRDAASGVLCYDASRDRLIADLDLYRLAPSYTNQEQLMGDIARQVHGELRVNPAWAFLGKPITVHSQGGCRMSELPQNGVTDADGQVHGCPGLYVLDGSILCHSVGVNPTATILAIAECNILAFIRKAQPAWPAGSSSPGAREYQAHLAGADAWRARAEQAKWHIRPVAGSSVPFESEPLGLKFHEKMDGYCAPTQKDPRTRDWLYRRNETRARPNYPVTLTLDAKTDNLTLFFEDFRHRLQITGNIELVLPGESERKTFPVTGFLELLVPRYKPYGLARGSAAREAQKDVAQGYATHRGAPSPGDERFMRYYLSFDQDAWRLEGYKRIQRQAGADAWRQTSNLFTKIGVPRLAEGGSKVPFGERDSLEVRAAGVVHVDLTGFLYDQLPSFEITGSQDPARTSWALGKFMAFFMGSLQRVYLPQVGSALDTLYRPLANNVQHEAPRHRKH
jgi:choline dehydrogenase-like flavoprotein